MECRKARNHDLAYSTLFLEVKREVSCFATHDSPTLAIRDQWVQRFVELFLPKGTQAPEWISRDLNNPDFLTVVTYQALHAAMTRNSEEEEESDLEEDEEESDEEIVKKEEIHSWLDQNKRKRSSNAPVPDLIGLLLSKGIQTVVLDEAHHLRTNWWKSLIALVKNLGHPKILALTATPPFDVAPAEWERYMEICGPVDATIPVPELVMEGNLCPHQDLVLFSTPSEAESAEITRFRNNVTYFVRNLQTNSSFTNHIRNHPWLNPPDAHIDAILDEPDFS